MIIRAIDAAVYIAHRRVSGISHSRYRGAWPADDAISVHRDNGAVTVQIRAADHLATAKVPLADVPALIEALKNELEKRQNESKA